MNNERRKRLAQAGEILEKMEELFSELLEITEEVRSDEEDAFANLPESFQNGEKGDRMQEAIQALENISMEDAFSEVRGYLDEAAQ